MSTIKDFKNAPTGATATRNTTGSRAVKTDEDRWSWVPLNGFYSDDKEMVERGCTLDPSVPTTAHEALDLAWELAHPVKEGQVIPRGTRYLEVTGTGLKEYTAQTEFKVSPVFAPIRTLDPLPAPEPDWLDAPAVLAGFDGWSHDEREVFVPTGPHNRWTRVGSSLESHWSDLRDVTPLYPKETEA